MSLFHKNFSWCSHIPVLFSTPDWRTGRRTFHTVRFPAGQGAMASSRACSSYRAQRGSLYALLLSHAIRCVPDYILSWLVRLFTRLPTLDAPSGRDGMIPAFWSLFSPLLWVRSGVHTWPHGNLLQLTSPAEAWCDGYEPKVPPVVFHFVSYICCMIRHGGWWFFY